ncbi:MAG: hypothetical protein ABH823_05685 [bacterium]
MIAIIGYYDQIGMQCVGAPPESVEHEAYVVEDDYGMEIVIASPIDPQTIPLLSEEIAEPACTPATEEFKNALAEEGENQKPDLFLTRFDIGVNGDGAGDGLVSRAEYEQSKIGYYWIHEAKWFFIESSMETKRKLLDLMTPEARAGLDFDLVYNDGRPHSARYHNPDVQLLELLAEKGHQIQPAKIEMINPKARDTLEKGVVVLVLTYKGVNCKMCHGKKATIRNEIIPRMAGTSVRFFSWEVDGEDQFDRRYDMKVAPTTIILNDGQEIARYDWQMDANEVVGILQRLISQK